MLLKRLSRPGAETAAALIGTAFSAILLILTAMNAGPLWRDEINTLSMAQMPSWKDFWNNLPFESFPPLWPLLLRLCGFLGLTESDAAIRMVGLCVGLFFLASLWLCSRWIGGRAPILSIALLGSLPAFIFIAGANRAYGLAACLLVLSFGMIWRMVELPSMSRIFGCGLTCLLFAHCVYYDIVFLCAMLAGGAMVVMRRRQWQTLVALTGIGAVSGASLAIYLPIIRRGSVYVPMNQDPDFNIATLWNRLGNAVAARSSARPEEATGPEIWIWVVLLLGGLIAALATQRAWEHQKHNPEAAAMAGSVRARADLALFCVVSMVLGTIGYSAFVLRLHYVTQSWYYIGMLGLCSISLEGLLNANWPVLRPWGLLRIGLMAAMLSGNAGSAWEEAHTRRSNVDLIASALGQKAAGGDLIVVQGAWEGITFNRYYHGQTRWVTVPPIDSHQVHRTDLVFEKYNQPDPMAPVLAEITDTLRGGHNVWIVGNLVITDPTASSSNPTTAVWLSSYFDWCAQVTTCLEKSARQVQDVKIPVTEPVNHLENLPVWEFQGYKPDADRRPLSPTAP